MYSSGQNLQLSWLSDCGNFWHVLVKQSAKKEICLFSIPEVEFLGFRVDKTGIHPSKGKVEAIQAAPKPENKQQLQAFLDLVNFYHSFLPNKASIAEPLHRLLDNDAPWNWSSDHTKAFNSLKQLISSESVLTPFDDSLPIVLMRPHMVSVLCWLTSCLMAGRHQSHFIHGLSRQLRGITHSWIRRHLQ
ncbi:hypothetical protein JTE90_021690 [Oedothorax gibbosus]|uniref:Reverse transcriptase/retrotransposon-derived protein RNase H-like domain-containing protein n=1 Tax=Oedothorax gibbosus TaxID=931172 RepID=A0AAV6TTX4_9ARAC|nr:hypothetical protein JTE90_021690 [Oedothorax gibbosus]